MNTLSIVCEEKYDVIACTVADYYAQAGDYQNHIRILTPKQYMAENGKNAVFNDMWLFSIGKNDCTNLYKHLINRNISEQGLFFGAHGHVAIAYYESGSLLDNAKKKGNEVVDSFKAVKAGKSTKEDFKNVVIAAIGLKAAPIFVWEMMNEHEVQDFCYTQKAVEILLSLEAQQWMISCQNG